MKRIFNVLGIFFLCSVSSYAQNCTIGTTVGSTCTLTMDGVLTIPAGANLTIEVKAWGAGGGSESAKNKRCGGGGGAYFNAVYSVSGGSTFPITVGQGALASAGGDTSFDFDGGGLLVVGGGGLGTTSPGAGGTGSGAIAGGDGGNRETGGGNLDAGGGGGGSGPGNGTGGLGGNPTNGVGGTAGMAGSPGAAGGAGGNDSSMGTTSGTSGAFPGGGAGGKGTTIGVQDGAAGGNGQVIVCVTEVLPVELIGFTAQTIGNHILLEWQTAAEVNNDGFETQRSKDGIVWDFVDFVEGGGTAFGLSTYKSKDRSPSHGLNYYRLKQMGFDGKSEYSNVISIVLNRQNEIVTFPNPLDNHLIIKAKESKEVNIQIYNTIGQTVYEKTQVVDKQLEIDVSMIEIGNYFLSISNSKTGVIIYQEHIVKSNR